MRRFGMLAALAGLATALLPHAAPASCHGNVPPCIAGVPASDRQILVLGSQFYLSETTVQAPGKVFVQNFDSTAHTMTHTGCIDGNASTPCAFDFALGANKNLSTAKRIDTGPGYLVAGTYAYVCTVPSHTMSGTLIVQ